MVVGLKNGGLVGAQSVLAEKIARPSSTCRSQNVALHLASLSWFTLSLVFFFIVVAYRLIVC